MKKIPLHIKILIGMALGAIYGLIAVSSGWTEFTSSYVKPFGTVFLNLLRMIAVPLVFVSLVTGVSSLRDVSKVRRIGTRTIAFYLSTTVLAVSLGLLLVNVMRPGDAFPKAKQEELKLKYSDNVTKKTNDAKEVAKAPKLQFLIDLVPTNIFKSASDNTQMLPIIMFAILIGISMILTPLDKITVIRGFFDGLNEIILKMIDLIMHYAPYGVFALIGSLLVEFSSGGINETLSLFQALGLYSLTVLVGLFLMIYVVYGTLLKIFTGRSIRKFFNSILPVQMLAFSTSSSSATLPVTMEHCEKHLGVTNEIASFVLPVGATVNMDGTSLYQSVATVFIAQALGIDLSFTQQLTIVLTATLASIGAAGVPGAGMVMLVIVLNSVGVPIEGITLIFAVDRILDMFRTTVNVTGDMVVAVVIQEAEERRKSFFEG
ncbi:MAG: dicarboxylate/amino acid:cation symporter [Leptospiraceae bacterium]|nr:dicarboxylate/amino acid:cation symporter [Leptospiraceae bacterium]